MATLFITALTQALVPNSSEQSTIMITIIYQSLWTLSAFIVAYIFYTIASSTLRARRLARIHGCRKLRNAPQKDPFFGIDVFLDGQKAMREKGFLQYLSRYFEEYGSTFKWNLMGDALIFTNEPKNLQAILATKFSDFDIGETRQQITKPFWGVGIFNSDGPLWAHSRALIRPNFTRDLVSDTRTYDSHVSNLISRIPSDGSTFDIQDLFFRLVRIPSAAKLITLNLLLLSIILS